MKTSALPFLAFLSVGLLASCSSVPNSGFAKNAVPPSPVVVPGLAAPLMALAPALPTPVDREQYAEIKEHGVTAVAEQPVSTFSVDVDTASYTNVRQRLLAGGLPVKDSVRIEELINYFDYAYPTPAGRVPPFSVSTEIAPTPWNPKTQLLMIGIKGYELAPAEIPPSNLVFLVDVSGSMSGPDRLPLIKESLLALVDQLRPQDRISLVVYAGRTAVLLEAAAGSEKQRVRSAIAELQAGGSTAGGSAIQMAYAIAERSFIQNGVNRIILATDGDFNVGVTDVRQLTDLVEEKRKSGVSLSLLGVGRGNLNDRLMEKLANVGNGQYSFLDSLREGKRVLVQQMAGSLAMIAKDVKLQVEFNPARVAEYRLIGYENRALNREDFANDKVDAGDIGAGHTVTALYEIALVGSGGERLPALRYAARPAAPELAGEFAHLQLRYQLPAGGESSLLTFPVAEQQMKPEGSANLKLAAAVAAFGQLLRGGTYLNDFSWRQVVDLAMAAGGPSNEARAEFIHLIHVAGGLAAKPDVSLLRP